MKKRVLFSLLILILFPLVIVLFQGVHRIHNNQQFMEQQFRGLITENLQNYQTHIEFTIDTIKSNYQKMLQKENHTEGTLYALSKKKSTIRQPFRARKNLLLYPDSTQTDLSQKEKEFIQRTNLLWRTPSLFANRVEAPLQETISRSYLKKASSIEYGWLPWYWEEGIHLLFWQRKEQIITGFEVERIALIAEIVAKLPENGDTLGNYQLWDGNNNLIYQWGAYEVKEADKPIASVTLSAPLTAWSLIYFTDKDPEHLATTSMTQQYILLFTVILLITFVALYFYREMSRDLREAQHRVSFVNQVSHELKTPLTNIRLYAELLQEFLDEEEEESPSELAIILSESQRLSRMITNILTFAKQEKATLKLHFSEQIVDTIITDILEQCQLSLTRNGITTIKTDLKAQKAQLVDKDALGQIIGNLISNVEKYASDGGYLSITTSETGEGVSIQVSDRGMGISKDKVKKIFEPYYRVSDKLTEGVSGAGIGLAISRELARLHGGELSVESSSQKTIFTCFLPKNKEA